MGGVAGNSILGQPVNARWPLDGVLLHKNLKYWHGGCPSIHSKPFYKIQYKIFHTKLS